MAERLATLLRQVQYAPDEVVVLVGHSHWFREFLRAYLGDAVAARDAAFASELTSKKLSNAGVARVDLDFGPDQRATRPIVDVQLLAGTTLVKG